MQVCSTNSNKHNQQETKTTKDPAAGRLAGQRGAQESPLVLGGPLRGCIGLAQERNGNHQHLHTANASRSKAETAKSHLGV